jgi:hypothetical protein
MNSAKRDKRVFNLAESFLSSLTTKDGFRVTQEMLSKYFQVEKPETMAGIYFRLLLSAQNANMKAGVIGGSIDGIENLRNVLCGFEAQQSVHLTLGILRNLKQFSTPYHFSGWTASPSPPQRR